VKNQISQRLLTPGIATPLIIEIFIRIIKMLKFIDPTSYILEIISDPIKKYLRQRKDTMRWIITTILSEEDTSIKEDLGKQYIKSTYSMISNNRDNDYDYISSDEDEAAAESWQPLPISSGVPSFKNKFSDIISILVNIFGSPEKFVEQYKRMLAERCVSDTNFSIENEIKNLELLKIKFGEHLLQGCDIIIKDVNDSTKINSTIKNLLSTENNNSFHSDVNEFELNCLIINKNFWPFQNNSIFSLQGENDNISISNNSLTSEFNFLTKNYDKFLNSVNNKLLNYKKKFTSIKFSRTLNYFTNIGFVDLTLSFENGTFCFRVSQLAALIINLFDESNEVQFENYTVDFISEKLNSSFADVKKKINFWISKGVLTECSKKIDENDEKLFYTPNKILKNLEFVFSNNLIIEEEIFHFEYVETETKLNLENAINSIIKNSGPRNFEQLYKNLVISYQVTFSEIKLKEVLGKMILEQKLFKEGEMYKLIVPNY
jgi:anaphase-promoting complex subunit 2